jgi:hypothetical protein
VGLLQRARDWFYDSAPAAPAIAPPPIVASVEKAARPAGSDGVASYGGYLQSGESHSALVGPRKWLTYTNALNESIVSTGARYFGNLLAGTRWHAEPNEAGGPDAQRGVEIVTAGLLNANMGKPWPLVVRKAAMYRYWGFSLHATALKRRKDGLVVFSAIEHRPQHTIEKWLRKDERSAWESVEQRTRMGTLYTIPLDECFYCVDDTLGDSPDGVGLLRHVIEPVRRLGLYQGLEGIAYQTDMGGMPVVRAPLAELISQAGSTNAAEQATAVNAATSAIRDVVANRIKSPEQQMYALLDSATYTAPDKAISGVPKWALEIVQSTTNGLPAINEVIKRLNFEIARVLGIDFALVGADGGSYSMHEDKTSMFATMLSVTLNEMSAFAMPLARRLVRMNGLDPDTATPRLVAEPISTESVLSAAQALAAMSTAGLHPKDPARTVLRSRMQLPPEPEPSEIAMAPRVPFVEPDEDVPDAEDVDDDESVDVEVEE